ncbi:MAG: dihydropyrimidine dehydrogenase, partial [Acidimicrobiia bacterium]
GKLTSVVLQRMELGEPDESGRRSPVPLEGDTFETDVSLAIVAIGNAPNPLLTNASPDLEVGRRGTLVVDDGGATNKTGVYAGGDIVTGGATVILAMGAGRRAAAAINEYLVGA